MLLGLLEHLPHMDIPAQLPQVVVTILYSSGACSPTSSARLQSIRSLLDMSNSSKS